MAAPHVGDSQPEFLDQHRRRCAFRSEPDLLRPSGDGTYVLLADGLGSQILHIPDPAVAEQLGVAGPQDSASVQCGGHGETVAGDM